MYWAILLFLLLSASAGTPYLSLGSACQAAQPGGVDNMIAIQPNIGSPIKPRYAAFSDDKRVFATSDGRRIKIWDIASGRLLRTLEHFAYNRAIAFHPDGKHLVGAYRDGTIKIWDVETGRNDATIQVTSPEEPSGVSALAFDAQRRLLLAGTQSGLITGWSLDGQTKAFSVEAKKEHGSCFIDGLGVSEDGAKLIAVSSACGVQWFDLRSKAVARAFKPANGIEIDRHLGADLFLVRDTESGCKSLAFIADASQTPARLTEIFSRSDCKGPSDRRKYEIAIVVDVPSRTLLAGREGSPNLDRWNLATGKLEKRLPKDPAGELLAASADLALVAIAVGGAIEIRKLETEERVSVVSSQGYEASTAFMTADLQTVVLQKTAGDKTQLVALPLGSAKPYFMAPRLEKDVHTFGMASAQGNLVALKKEGDYASEVHVIRAADGSKVLAAPVSLKDEIWTAKISPDGTKIFLVGKRGLLLDAITGRVLLTFDKPKDSLMEGLWSATFSRDGRYFAFARDGAEVWDLQTLRLFKRIPPEDDNSCTSLLFSADNRSLICGSRDAGIFVFDIATAKAVQTFDRETIAGHVNTASLALSEDGKLIAAGPGQRATSSGDIGQESGIHLWDAKSGALRFILRGHEANVYALAFTADGRWLVSGSVDGTIRYWDVNTGAPVFSFASSKEGRWAAVTDKGFFAASANAGDLLSVVRGYEAVGVAQMWQSLFNPDLVQERLAGDPNGDVERAAEVANLGQILDSGPAPQVEIASPVRGGASSSDVVAVSARITDRGKGVGRVEWRVNGVTAGVTRAPADAGPVYDLTQNVALDAGKNTIEVVAYNSNNLLASSPARAAISFAGAVETAKPKLHVLAIGINDYVDAGGESSSGRFGKLELAAGDARAVAAALGEGGAKLYSGVRVRTAIDDAASAASLDRIVSEMAAEIQPRDAFVFFAAAHGYSVDGRFYMIPQDYQGGGDPRALATRAIDQAKLQDWIVNRIKARRVLILLDTCESGALTQGYTRSRIDAPASEAAIGRLHEATGRPVLTAAAEGKPAFEGFEGHGVFTWALLDALKNGDRNGNGSIELSELVVHVQDQVPQISAKLNGRGVAAVAAEKAADERQSARFGSRGEDFTLVQRLE
jgi:WD40 repeat protein/uncharacterized caspase-like protein